MNKKLKQLDEDISTKLIKLSNKYPIVSYEYLVEIQKVCEWAKMELLAIELQKHYELLKRNTTRNK